MKTLCEGVLALGALVCSLLVAGCPQPTAHESLLPAPTDLTTAAASSTSISVSWSSVDGAEGYDVHRSDSESGVFAKVNSAVVIYPPFEDAGLLPNRTYWYKVAALKGGREQTMSCAFSGITNLAVPGNIAVRAQLPQELELSWDAVSGSDGYNLYRSDSSAGWFMQINPALVVATSYTDCGLSVAASYWYKVVAVRDGVEQDHSNAVSGVTMLGAPENAKVSYRSGNSLRVSWDALSGAAGYNVYRGDTEIGGFVQVNALPVNGTSYDDAGLAAETLYWYRVVGLRDGAEQTPGAAVRGFTAQVWAKTYGGSEDDSATSVRQTADGGYIVAGVSDSFTTYTGTCWVLKLDPGGEVSWQKSYGGCRVFSSIMQTTDGGYILGGRTLDMWSTYDFVVLKLDSGGSISWQKKIGRSTAGSDTLNSVQQTGDGGYILGGHTSYDILIVKVDSSGNLSWARTYGGSSMEYAQSIRQTTDGGYIVAGSTMSFGAGSLDCWVLKLDSAGSVTWQKTYGGSGNDGASCIEQTADGGYIVAGHLGDQFWVFKLNSDGAVSWQKTFSGVGDWSYTRYWIEQTPDEDYIVASYTGSVGAGLWDFLLLKLDADGAVLWQRAYGGSHRDLPASIQRTEDNGYIVAGSTESFGAGKEDYWIMSIPGSGTLESAEFMTPTSFGPQDATATVGDTSVTPKTPSLRVGAPSSSAAGTNATVMTQYP